MSRPTLRAPRRGSVPSPRSSLLAHRLIDEGWSAASVRRGPASANRWHPSWLGRIRGVLAFSALVGLSVACGSMEPGDPGSMLVRVIESRPASAGFEPLPPAATTKAGAIIIRGTLIVSQGGYRVSGALSRPTSDSLVAEVRAVVSGSGLQLIWRLDYEAEIGGLAAGVYHLGVRHRVDDVVIGARLDTTMTVP